jgi:oligoendopeptidase F
LRALKDSHLLESEYELLFAKENESVEEFEQFGSEQQIDFEDYNQPEEKRVKLFNRFKSFLFQPLDLDVSDSNFASAFCGGMR